MRFSERLKVLRKELGLTQGELAKTCDVKFTVISKYENEIIKPSFEMLSKIGLAYNTNLNWLINEIGTIFIEQNQKHLLKNGTDEYAIEVLENISNNVVVNDISHSLELTNDIKVEYYDANSNNYTKIYHKSGDVEYQGKEAVERNLEYILRKIQSICKDKNQFEFVLTAIDAINDENSLKELKMLIKGMEISKKQ